jgi:single-strand DNA-binding protein
LKNTQSGIAVATTTIAVDRNYQGKGQEKQTDFINLMAWRNTAEFMSKYFEKGRMIIVEGEIQTRNYENKEGKKVYLTEVVVSNCYFGDSKKDSGSNNNKATTNDTDGFIPVEDDDDLPF